MGHQLFEAASRERLAHSDQISNQALGLSGACRAGTRIAISDKHYQEICPKALSTKSEIAALRELSRVLGLRSEEAVQSCQYLKAWQIKPW